MTIDAPSPAFTTRPECDQPRMIYNELRWIIENALTNAPRSQQKLIGPSEIGTTCMRTLAHKLAGTPEPERDAAWKPAVGTAIHAYLEGIFTNHYLEPERYLLEQRVTVGDINGTPISGSCDLYDLSAGYVIDWKTTGKTRLQQYKRKGPGQQYRTQAHLYGRGWQQRGETPTTVMLVFLPRDGELSDTHVWAEPYDERVAIDALDRATGVQQLVDAIGIDATIASYGECEDPWCDWCPQQRKFQPPTEQPTTASLFTSVA